MTQDQPDDGVVPGWPPLSASADENSFSVRAFGLGPCDLDLDFADTRPADLVNRLLAATLRRRDGRGFQKAELWSWTLGRRVQGLLAMAVATRGRNLTLQTASQWLIPKTFLSKRHKGRYR